MHKLLKCLPPFNIYIYVYSEYATARRAPSGWDSETHQCRINSSDQSTLACWCHRWRATWSARRHTKNMCCNSGGYQLDKEHPGLHYSYFKHFQTLIWLIISQMGMGQYTLSPFCSDQNSWVKMDVHPPKNGMYRYWSIAKLLFHGFRCHFSNSLQLPIDPSTHRPMTPPRRTFPAGAPSKVLRFRLGNNTPRSSCRAIENGD